MLDKNAIYARALKHHSPKGRVIKALDKVFSTVYPAGTNLVLEYLKEFVGMRYGHVNACMDKVTDCAELWRITFYIWYGIDIGNYSDAEYKDKRGEFVTKIFKFLPTCRPLDLVFYDTSSKDNKVTGHVAGIFDSKRIFQSGAASNHSRVNFSPIFWLPKGKTSACFKGVKRFLTDEQYNSVIVGKESEEDMLIKIGSKGPLVEAWQKALKSNGYNIGTYGPAKDGVDGEYGDKSAAATKLFQKACGLPETGEVDNVTAATMWGKAHETEISLLKKENEKLKIDLTAHSNSLLNDQAAFKSLDEIIKSRLKV